MSSQKTLTSIAALLYLVLAVASSAFAQSSVVSRDLFEGFGPGWREAWKIRPLASRATRYDIITTRGDAALRASSRDAASALWRRLDLERPVELSLSWRWRVERSLGGNARERTKQGDDYAARVLVSFGADVFSRRSRALCYVWADGEPVGSVFRNPRAENVVTIVLESGGGLHGAWIKERRDVLEDYRTAFREEADAVAAIAVIVDTDDTESEAVTWFDDVRIHYGS